MEVDRSPSFPNISTFLAEKAVQLTWRLTHLFPSTRVFESQQFKMYAPGLGLLMWDFLGRDMRHAKLPP